MVDATGGVWQSICSTVWGPIFTAVAQAVAVATLLPCVYDIPEPPDGETLEPSEVNLVFTSSGGAEETVPNVIDATGCGPTGGWYYDNPTTPSQIILCPSTCTMFQSDPGGRVDVAFGCETVIL
jgi:hypothetical protein